MAPVVLLLSTADTELLAARGSDAVYRTANPARVEPEGLPALLDGVDVVVLRLLGGRRAWPEGVDALVATGRPVVLLGGEAAPDAELMAASTVPAGVASEALAYLAAGGTANLRELHRFLSDTVLLTGEGFAAPEPTPEFGVLGDRAQDPARPTVGVVFYRAHALSGNTAFVETLCEQVEARGANALPVFCGSLRQADDELMALLSGVDALVTTVLAAGGTVASSASAGGEEDAWDPGALAALDVPVLQGLSLTTSRAVWEASDAALSPMDAAMQVAIPEFDGRLITVPFSFKETEPGDDLPVYRADPERAARLAGLAVRHACMRRTPVAERKLAVVLSSYPTKHSRVGNAVGLDTPASAVVLLNALRDAGYTIGEFPQDSDELIHTLIAAGGHDVEWLTEEQLAAAPSRVPLEDYRRWFDALPAALTDGIREHWGEAPGSLYVDGSDVVLASLTFGNVVLMIQPPRGFGENPIAIYHDPDLPPSHHYLAAYRWLEHSFGAHAVVHLGKHGTLEWLPGKGLGLSAECAPDAVLGELPLVYPFIVNDPGEGTQAKRRGHAVVVDHLVPPMARADTYGEMAKLEQLLDEYATVQAMDPAKTPALRARIWEVVQAAQLHHDLHVDTAPGEDDFDDFVLHIDGYLCEVKDVQIRDGLHVLGGVPADEAQVNLVLSILRATQVWGGKRALPGLRAALAAWAGLDEQALLAEPGAPVAPFALDTDTHHPGGASGCSEQRGAPEGTARERLVRLGDGPSRTGADLVDVLESVARQLVITLQERGWSGAAAVVTELLGEPVADVVAVLEFGCTEVVPRLARTTDEIGGVLHALDGGHVPAGPSGSPTRGLVNVLPTGRNFYSVDPKAIPSRSAWEIGSMLADSLIARHLADTGEYPRSVGLTVWGTSAMRTQGDDLAEILALIGTRPVWDEASRRVTGFEIVPREELGRPRIDVTVRISGFFRDAFPHVITLLDDAFAAVAEVDEPDNFLREHVETDVAEHGDRRRATARIFGSKPGAYGAGLLPLIDARNWRSDADLAEVYAVWGGYAYGRGLDGREARADMEQSFRRISVAAKNQDTREHDIVDSDDYFQYHGGMVATVRALTGRTPAAYVGDSAVTDAVRTRTLAEETKRVFRARVVNPKWIAAMQRHGYKGAFELAATVDYLFGYDATAGVVDDWMYTQLAESYVFDGTNRAFMEKSNPWALRGITERLLEAAERGMWAKPDDAVLDRLRQTYLELEGDLEGQE
ncbi:cobaltochelatase subunit CobN [Pseudonocardia sp. KRD-184]|uniref:Cobaltochelatase subunit CobN n=3 Tax=Pseudonocardia oceani TaxID=2792013 RepID=A0ABS6U3R6_9PSEU|nr:cobaltochelatase subunit CobN [Pseudonocardia oceani]MBW0098961.1 cobaltochelatase subunit CobN [Pseudonocardia oceani]MBW0111490.1 cobaltochelatase subunit CobN [Pseudonocardia oceani]MBW0125211.1 cobaltochelatase subunit CobN [Pseudonocardia oceani]MBW0126865.1 cobaltochelatase subunit CobN [Pseudonocardia oceani]